MNLLAWPCQMEADTVAEVLRGGSDVCREAECVIVGGHTIDDKEPKYGLSVMGVAEPDAVVRNVGARAGDALVLTKPLGVGIMNTTLKRGLETEDSIRVVIDSMTHLNAAAAQAMLEVGVNAATDVTGFGILGHLREMALGSDTAARLDLSALPVFDGALEYSRDRVRPGRTEDVISALDPHVEWGPADDAWKGVLCDPQTSGGLLMAVDGQRVDDLVSALDERGEMAHVVGCVETGDPGRIVVG
jgi:selenide,water dikinase